MNSDTVLLCFIPLGDVDFQIANSIFKNVSDLHEFLSHRNISSLPSTTATVRSDNSAITDPTSSSLNQLQVGMPRTKLNIKNYREIKFVYLKWMRWGIKNMFCQAAGSVLHGIADYQSVCQMLITSNSDSQMGLQKNSKRKVK